LDKDALRARLLATFRGEADEHLQSFRAALMALDRRPSRAEGSRVLEEAFRVMHTLKGAARSVSLRDVESVCQACESVLSTAARSPLPPGAEVLDALHAAAAGIARLLGQERASVDVRGLVARVERASHVPARDESRLAGDVVQQRDVAQQRDVVQQRDAGQQRDAEQQRGVVEEARAGDAAPDARAAQPPPIAPPLPSGQSLRVPVADLDAVLVRSEQLLIPKLASGERAREARELVAALDAVEAQLRASRRQARRAGELDVSLRACLTRARDLQAKLAQDQRALTLSVEGIDADARRLRMSPASLVLEALPAMVRDLAQAQGKEVAFECSGGAVELDRKVLDAVKDPLVHLVRNAVDHGVEAPAERERAGKPRRAQLAVALTAVEGGRVLASVSDDGRGIDPAQVKAAALRSHLLTPEQAEALGSEAALELIYRSGLSTSAMVTDVSGHGLGLAIVKERVERLGGHVGLETRAGAGTTVRLVLPATIATARGLLVRAARQLFLLPHEAIERAVRIGAEGVKPVEGRATIALGEQRVRAERLSSLLGLADGEPEPGGARTYVVVRSDRALAAVMVDEILGDREVLVKELRPPLVRVPNVAAAGLLGSGDLALILRPADLARAVTAAARPPARGEEAALGRRRARVLVVDDSITTRTMEKSLLEAAGYETRVAVDGVDAWTLLKTEAFDLLISDVDMPRMDGFELTRRVRGDQGLAELPVILVTALESREDKERGIQVGANAYVVKSSFEQSNLLEIVRRLT
jgi:two-component system chemotaxis sensor kinase CheA